VIIAARWVAGVPVTITFNFNGLPGQQPGSVSIPTGMPIGNNLIYIPSDAWPGRGFIGWRKHTESGARVDGSTFFVEDTTLVARWTDPIIHAPFWTAPTPPITEIRIPNFDSTFGNVPGADWPTAMRRSITLWNFSTTSVQVSVNNQTDNTVVPNFHPGIEYLGWLVPVPGNVNIIGPELRRFEISLFPLYIQATASLGGNNPNRDELGRFVTSVFSHEIGHAFGLEDNPRRGHNQNNDSIMNLNRDHINIMGPRQFDVDNVNWIYK